MRSSRPLKRLSVRGRKEYGPSDATHGNATPISLYGEARSYHSPEPRRDECVCETQVV